MLRRWICSTEIALLNAGRPRLYASTGKTSVRTGDPVDPLAAGTCAVTVTEEVPGTALPRKPVTDDDRYQLRANAIA